MDLLRQAPLVPVAITIMGGDTMVKAVHRRPHGGGHHAPCRVPHYTISDVGLIGGEQMPMEGEVSLAHNGVLFLDELPEFCRHGLEVLRQPLEESVIYIQSRGVLDLNTFMELSIRVMAVRDSGSAR
jgi:predicted ATPase with chaperone activity